MNTTIIGIDCAVQPRSVGLALGYFDGDRTHLQSVSGGLSEKEAVIKTVAAWISVDSPTLLALDAPLGWPAAFREVFNTHQAGASIAVPEPNLMFRRLTDRVIRCAVGKQSLDVGADRIARTAFAALDLLQQLRQQTGQTIPLIWKPLRSPICGAIEVYPAATLKACNIDSTGYKKRNGRHARQYVLKELERSQIIDLPPDPSYTGLMEENDDALDAGICVLAGTDFLRRQVIQPTKSKIDGLATATAERTCECLGGEVSNLTDSDLERIVRIEGWIWVRPA
jgi:hypothetical protein